MRIHASLVSETSFTDRASLAVLIRNSRYEASFLKNILTGGSFKRPEWTCRSGPYTCEALGTFSAASEAAAQQLGMLGHGAVDVGGSTKERYTLLTT